MSRGIVIGFLLIMGGIGLFAYYDYFVRTGREAGELLTEGKLILERGDKDSVNSSINIFTKIISKYPGTRAEVESYYYIAQGYEKLGLQRLAYLKYLYLLKSNRTLPAPMDNEIKARMAHLRITKNNTEEGIHQLLSLLNLSSNRDFRSKVYTELGHTYLNLKSYDKSKKMFDIALYENGGNEDAILGKARSFKLMGYPNAAYDLYEYFFKYYGSFSQYTADVTRSYISQVYESGITSYRKGKYHDSISYFQRLLKNFPNISKSENAMYWAGESYYALGKYDNANYFYASTLSNGYHHKDEDARIKRGCAYFMTNQYDLAAREFQIYLDSYPHGRYVTTATRWKEMSTKELLYRIKDKMLPEEKETEDEGGDANETLPEKSAGTKVFEKENVAEL